MSEQPVSRVEQPEQEVRGGFAVDVAVGVVSGLGVEVVKSGVKIVHDKISDKGDPPKHAKDK